MAALQAQQAQLAIELAAAEFKFRQLDTTGSLTLWVSLLRACSHTTSRTAAWDTQPRALAVDKLHRTPTCSWRQRVWSTQKSRSEEDLLTNMCGSWMHFEHCANFLSRPGQPFARFGLDLADPLMMSAEQATATGAETGRLDLGTILWRGHVKACRARTPRLKAAASPSSGE